jgi:uncharacterized protein (TIGR01777 family)
LLQNAIRFIMVSRLLDKAKRQAEMTEKKRVVITGATGLIGKKLVTELDSRGYQVVSLSREPAQARHILPETAECVGWTTNPEDAWAVALEGAMGVVHLAGAPLMGARWSASYKATIRQSRVLSTQALVKALALRAVKPQVLISGSAVGYYGPSTTTALDEEAAGGTDFLSEVCQAWEKEAFQAVEMGIRVVCLRTGVVLDRAEGALPKMALPFKLGCGGPILPGTQWLSWIHIADMVGLISWALEDERVTGPLNATAPEPLTNRDFMANLGQAMGRPAWLPVPGLALRLALGEAAELLSTGQRVLPKKAQRLGYEFKYSNVAAALRHLI